MRTDPFRELDRFASQMFGSQARPASMPLDAYRHGDVFVVDSDLPGVEPSTIELTVERNVLSIRAERSRPHQAELLIGERDHGSFARQLFLGETLDADNLTADYHNGVLTIRVPVAEQAKPRRIEVGTSASASLGTRSDDVVAAEAVPTS